MCDGLQIIFKDSLYICINMAVKRDTVPVSMPRKLVEDIDRLVDEGEFSSRSDAMRFAARILTHQESTRRLHDLTEEKASEQVRERLARKDVPGY